MPEVDQERAEKEEVRRVAKENGRAAWAQVARVLSGEFAADLAAKEAEASAAVVEEPSPVAEPVQPVEVPNE